MKPRLSLPLSIDRQAFPLYLMNFLVNLGVGIMAPVLPQLKAEFAVSYGEAGLIVSAFGLSRLIFDLPVGWASERFKPILILLLGTFLLTAGSIAAALSPSYVALIASRAVMGAGSAMCTTTALIILSHMSTPKNRAKIMSMFPMGAFAGVSFSPLIGGYLAALFDWRVSFFFCGFTAFSSMIFVLITQRGRKRPQEQEDSATQRSGHHHKPTAKSGSQLLTGSTAARALIAVNVAAVVIYFSRQGLLQALIPLYAGNILRMNVETIGTMMSVSAFITMAVLWLGGVLADRHGRMLIYLPAIGCLIAGGLIIPRSGDLVLLMTSVVLISIGGMGISIPGVFIGDLSSRTTLTRNMGLLRFLSDFGIFAGPVVLSSLVDYFDYYVPVYFDAVLLFVSAVSVVLLIPFGSVARRPVVQAREIGETE